MLEVSMKFVDGATAMTCTPNFPFPSAPCSPLPFTLCPRRRFPLHHCLPISHFLVSVFLSYPYYFYPIMSSTASRQRPRPPAKTTSAGDLPETQQSAAERRVATRRRNIAAQEQADRDLVAQTGQFFFLSRCLLLKLHVF